MAEKLTEDQIQQHIHEIIKSTSLQIGEILSTNGINALKSTALAAYTAEDAAAAARAIHAGKADLARAVQLAAILAAEGIVRATYLVNTRTEDWDPKIRESMNDIIVEALAQIDEGIEE